jgi:tRNA threonylcarbamoyladenosine biosynthesis protein TsaB
MKILALELSTVRGGLAWLDGDVDLAREWLNDRKNSAPFFQNLDQVTKKFGTPDTIIVGLGPGSYAGTRIAISGAIGLQVSSGAHLIGFPSICAIESEEADYCVIGDARRKSLFFARISRNELMEGPDLFGDEELKIKLAELRNDTSVFSSESLPHFPEATVHYPSARLLARLAQDPKRKFSLPPLEPMYLREPYLTKAKTRALGT